MIELLSDLTEGNLVEDWTLKERIDTMEATEHVLALLFKVDNLVVSLSHIVC